MKIKFVELLKSILNKGELEIGGQQHFYMETHSCLVIPKHEHGEYEIIAGVQDLNSTLLSVSALLQIPSNRITCKTKRLGGGFGGKETRAAQFVYLAALAAKKTKRPVRCVLDRDQDTMITGGNHPYYGKYRVRLNKDLEFKEYDVEFVSNCGFSLDASSFIMDYSLAQCDNVYYFPKMRTQGKLAKTNMASNTA